jgi:hypothetical protein
MKIFEWIRVHLLLHKQTRPLAYTYIRDKRDEPDPYGKFPELRIPVASAAFIIYVHWNLSGERNN